MAVLRRWVDDPRGSQEAIRHQLRITPHWSSRDIARLLGCTDKTVQTSTGSVWRKLVKFTSSSSPVAGGTKGLPMILYRDRQEAKRNEAMFRDAKGMEGQPAPSNSGGPS